MEGRESDIVYMFDKTRAKKDYKIFVSGEVNARLNYLYTVIKENMISAIQEIHRSCCITQKMLLDLLISLSEERQTTFITRVLLNEVRYTVVNMGDVLQLKQCLPITKYRFLPRNRVNCTRNMPIEYELNGIIHSAYMNEISHSITQFGEIIPCEQQQPFFFESNSDDGLILLSNITEKFDIPYMPTLQFDQNPEPLKEEIFHSQGIFSASELSSQDTLLGLAQQVHKPTNIDKIISNKLQGYALSPDQLSWAEAFSDMALSPLKSSAIQFITVGGFVFFVLICCACCCCCRKKLWKICKCCGKCCCKCTTAKKCLTKKKEPEQTLYVEVEQVPSAPPAYAAIQSTENESRDFSQQFERRPIYPQLAFVEQPDQSNIYEIPIPMARLIKKDTRIDIHTETHIQDPKSNSNSNIIRSTVPPYP